MMNVGIIGAGTMGAGIAQVAATAGCQVILLDLKREALDKAKAGHEKIMARLVEKGRVTQQDHDQILERIEYVDSISAFAKAELIIEAIVEKLEVKQNVFKHLEEIVSQDCIIASNTSSLSMASIAASLQHPERCVGIHFFNPAPLMKLVEIIPAVQTDKAILDRAVKVIKGWGKNVAVAKDTPGFIVNRVARPFYGEALRILEEGIADESTIDRAMRELGFRMGRSNSWIL